MRITSYMIIGFTATFAQQLTLYDLNHGNEYSIIQLGKIQLTDNYTKIIHKINLTKYDETLSHSEKQLEYIPTDTEYLQTKIKNLKIEIYSLLPHPIRQRRGLINFLGTGLKYVYGTMDDDDRQEIEERLSISERNAHNAIINSNKRYPNY